MSDVALIDYSNLQKTASYVDGKFFRAGMTDETVLEMLMEKKKTKEENYLPLGEIRGQCFGLEDMGPSKNPEYQGKENSIKIVGDFEAIEYTTGEIKSAAGVFLPNYFRKLVIGMMQSNPGETSFHIQMGFELTGRKIPFAWCVRNRLPSNPESALAKMKATTGALSVPPTLKKIAGKS